MRPCVVTANAPLLRSTVKQLKDSAKEMEQCCSAATAVSGGVLHALLIVTVLGGLHM